MAPEDINVIYEIRLKVKRFKTYLFCL